MGPPGSGKGTQSDLLTRELGVAHFSMGEALRDFGKGNSEMAKRIKNTIDQGIIVNDEDAKIVFFTAIDKLTDRYEGILLDGFPRTLGQISFLDELVNKYHVEFFKALILDVNREKLIDRLSKRKTCMNCKAIYLPGVLGYDSNVCTICGGKLVVRDDDNPAGVAKRFDEFLNKTAPVKKYYEAKGILTHINGDQMIGQVHEDIVKALDIK